jgi:serine/threonine protein kinase
MTIEKLIAAKRPQDVFGKLPEDDDARKAKVTARFKALAREFHPDANSDPRATEAFQRLNMLFAAAMNRNPVVDPVLIRTKRRAYKIEARFGRGDVSNLYEATYEDDEGETQDGIIKIARSPKSNTLIQNEAQTLKKILSDKDIYDDASPYFPGYIETFGYRAAGQKVRQAIAFKREFNLVTLEQVREVYPDGVIPKHAAWMFRRLLMAMGFAHAAGVVHGAILPRHVLLEPALHGLVLCDWKHAVETGGHIHSIPAGSRDFYPQDVLDKKPATHETDIYMAVECMKYVMGTQPQPRWLPRFFKGCQARRVPGAFDLKREFDELIVEAWGPRKFIPFPMEAVA